MRNGYREYNSNIYEIDSDGGIDISIPVEFNQNKNPKFYDDSNPKKKYYKHDDAEYSLDKGAACNVPLINMNIHCSGTHTETAKHINEDGVQISSSYHRHFLEPSTKDSGSWEDTDISGEDARVQAVATATWTDLVKTAWQDDWDAKFNT